MGDDTSVFSTITQPWRNPVSYLTLAFWVVIFAVVAFALYDSLRIVTHTIKSAAS